MPAFSIARSITIDAPADKVFDTIADFTSWPTWSPWLPIDPDVELNYTGEPGAEHSGYSWDGAIVGSGAMEHLQLDRPNRIEDNLQFIRPMKSRSDVQFDLKAKNDSTEVTWRMGGKLPFFLFFLKAQIETFVAMDYDRGLKMLKEFIETGEVLSKLDVMGPQPFEEMSVIGARDSASLQQIGPAMEKALGKVNAAVDQNSLCGDGAMISIYHANDIKRGILEFTSGYVVDAAATAPSGLQKATVPAGNYLQVRHTGGYENLGNAWSGAYQYARYKKLKIAKRPGFEIYRNHPDEAAKSELITDVYVPLK